MEYDVRNVKCNLPYCIQRAWTTLTGAVTFNHSTFPRESHFVWTLSCESYSRVFPCNFLASDIITQDGRRRPLRAKVARHFETGTPFAASQSITILLISLRYDWVEEKRVINGINGNGSYVQHVPIAARHCLAITVSHSINTGDAKRINVAVQTQASMCAGGRSNG